MNFGSTVLDVQGTSAIIRPGGLRDPAGTDGGVFLGGGKETHDFLEALRAVVESPNIGDVVADLQHVAQMNSEAIGAILAAKSRLDRDGRGLAIAGAQRRVRAALDTLKVSRVVGLFDSVEAALEAKRTRPNEGGSEGGPGPGTLTP